MTDLMAEIEDEWLHQSRRSLDTQDGGIAANLLDRIRTALEAKDARIAELEAALKPFADEAGIPPMPGDPDDPRKCSMKFLRAARDVYLGEKE